MARGTWMALILIKTMILIMRMTNILMMKLLVLLPKGMASQSVLVGLCSIHINQIC